MRKFATTAIDNFQPLVTLLVFKPSGELVGRREVNKEVLEPFTLSHQQKLQRFLKFLRSPDMALK